MFGLNWNFGKKKWTREEGFIKDNATITTTTKVLMIVESFVKLRTLQTYPPVKYAKQQWCLKEPIQTTTTTTTTATTTTTTSSIIYTA